MRTGRVREIPDIGLNGYDNLQVDRLLRISMSWHPQAHFSPAALNEQSA